MTGDLEHAALAIVLSVKSKAAFFAREIREAIQGAGTRDKDLIRILVSRSEVKYLFIFKLICQFFISKIF